MTSFDRKFGPSFIEALPRCPGVYLVYDARGTLIYVGKAKNLRRRLSQYRNAKRRRAHRKMRSIVADADRIEYETHETEFEALIRETRLIQEHRPKWNVAGAFYFLYPMLGIREKDGDLHLCYTTQPELFPEYSFHGAYRSRHLTRAAYFSLLDLFAYVGHPNPPSRKARVKYSYERSFRRLPAEFAALWERFFRGESNEASEALILALVENASARCSAPEIQDCLNHLKRFWRFEATVLYRARQKAGVSLYPVPQKERDILFLKSSRSWNESRHPKSLECPS